MDSDKMFNFVITVFFVMIILVVVISFIANIESCEINAEKLGIKGEWSMDGWSNTYCIYTLSNGRKINSDDYKYVLMEKVD